MQPLAVSIELPPPRPTKVSMPACFASWAIGMPAPAVASVTSGMLSGSAPCRQAAAGETIIGISYSTPGVKAINDGAPIKIILPEEGLGWEIEATAIIKGAKNVDDARKLADWVSSREAAQISSKFLPITAYDDISELPPNYPEGEKPEMVELYVKRGMTAYVEKVQEPEFAARNRGGYDGCRGFGGAGEHASQCVLDGDA